MKYYCDYCDTYLTHDSPSVRKTHCNGRKHKENVRLFYQKWLEEQVQKLVDDTTAAFKAGKIASNPFQSGTGNAAAAVTGAMIPPPQNMANKTNAPNTAPAQAPPMNAPMGGPMPGMPMMGPPQGGPMHPMMQQMQGRFAAVGMRPPMGMMGPPMGQQIISGRPPLLAGPPPAKMVKRQ